MIAILIDTNAYTAFKQGLPDAIAVVQRAPQLLISSIVIGELLAGFAVGSRETQNRDELDQFLASVRVVVVGADERTAAYYATVYRSLRAKGRPIPTNDMWIAATALQHGSALFSFDGHFQSIDGLIVGATAVELGLP
jgi:predicted nucleic acid-binding protein